MSIEREMVHRQSAKVRQILLEDWDPIIIGSNPNLADEYDSFIPEILRAWEAGMGVDALATLLLDIEEDWRNDYDDRRRICRDVAIKLLAELRA